jgi:NAD(P)-dependent dehydrogenase (short-subunit alcohol dehydrogenase family)
VRREEDGAALKAADPSGRVEPLRLDVTDEVSIESAVAHVEERVGEAGLAALVNNAGVAVGGPLEHLDLDDLRTPLEINVVGQVAVTQAALPLIRRGKGRIVFTGSIGGRMALPFVGPYNASKSAIAAIASSLRQELRPWNIPVILIEPGSVATPIWDKGSESASTQTDALTDEAKAQYGATLQSFRKLLVETGERGSSPEKVAEFVEKALTSSNPPLRRALGPDAKVQAGLVRVLPGRAMESFIAWQLRRAGRS